MLIGLAFPFYLKGKPDHTGSHFFKNKMFYNYNRPTKYLYKLNKRDAPLKIQGEVNA